MYTVLETQIDPFSMPLVQVDSEALHALLEKSKQFSKELETLLYQASSGTTKSIVVRKPLDVLQEIHRDFKVMYFKPYFDPYPFILRLADALAIYATNTQKIGNDFKHLFEDIFVKCCKKFRYMDFEGVEGLNTVFISTVCKVRDIKWLLQIIACYTCYIEGKCDNLFTITKQNLQEYSKIGSRDCQVLMNQLVACHKDHYFNESHSYILFTEIALKTGDLDNLKKWVDKGASLTREPRKCKCFSSESCFNSNCSEYTYNLEQEIFHSLHAWKKEKRNSEVFDQELSLKRCECILWLIKSHNLGYIHHYIESKSKSTSESIKSVISEFLTSELYKIPIVKNEIITEFLNLTLSRL